MLIIVFSPSEMPICIRVITCGDMFVINFELLLVLTGHKLVNILYKLIAKLYEKAQNLNRE